MFEYILLFFCLIPTMLGLAELLHYLKSYILSPKKRIPSYLLVNLVNTSPQLQLSLVIEKYRWQGHRYAEKIIAVYSNMDLDDLEECKQIAFEYNITICSKEELYFVLSEELK